MKILKSDPEALLFVIDNILNLTTDDAVVGEVTRLISSADSNLQSQLRRLIAAYWIRTQEPAGSSGMYPEMDVAADTVVEPVEEAPPGYYENNTEDNEGGSNE